MALKYIWCPIFQGSWLCCYSLSGGCER